MDQVRMVHLRTVHSDFHARVIAARLGADGMLTELRGGSGIYPGAAISVFIDEHDLDSAQELLMADEVEDAFVEPIYDVERAIRRRRLMMVAAIVILAWSGVAFRVV
jgi:hypothetical protein